MNKEYINREITPVLSEALNGGKVRVQDAKWCCVSRDNYIDFVSGRM